MIFEAFVAYALTVSQAQNWIEPIGELISKKPAEAAAAVAKAIPKEELAQGANPRDSGLHLMFAIEVKDARKAEVSLVDPPRTWDTRPPRMGQTIRLKKLTDTGLFAGVVKLNEGDAFLAQYRVDGKTVGGPRQVEAYSVNPYSVPPEGGLRGELRDMGEFRAAAYPGTSRKWHVYLPPHAAELDECWLLVAQDAQWDRHWMATFLDNMAAQGKIKPTVGVFLEPGSIEGRQIGNRSREYDQLSPEYVTMLEKEILPEVQKLAKISTDPAKRAITGVSSGGICSWTACWERPDLFSTAISFVGSFDNIASGASRREGGHNYPFLIRKMEKKPIRMFFQDGDNDLENEHGNWWLGNLQMKSALAFKGYDHVWVPGAGFHSTRQARSVFDRALIWWQSGKDPIDN